MRVIRLTLAALIFAAAPLYAHAASLTVFAAASLSDVLPAVAHIYKAKTGEDVAFSFAASSVLAKQIDASGGADMFISADEAWMDYLQKNSRIDNRTRVDLLGNSLVMIAPKTSGATLAIAPKFALAAALKGGRLAVADTATVPAGRYAQEALTNLGVWNSVSGQLAQAENVRVALAYVARGEAPLGIVYKTDAAVDPDVKIVGSFPASSHKPIVYPVALIKDARPSAAGFLAFFKSQAAIGVFEKAGFTVSP
jgi:molybdate transport system substrate-binding protein